MTAIRNEKKNFIIILTGLKILKKSFKNSEIISFCNYILRTDNSETWKNQITTCRQTPIIKCSIQTHIFTRCKVINLLCAIKIFRVKCSEKFI